MYAVIKTGGKQYRVQKDDLVSVEKIEQEKGATVAFDSVLMLGDGAAVTLGTPFVDGAKVEGEIVDQARAPKITVFKKKRRKGYRRKKGHRQDITLVKITAVEAPGR